MLSRVQSEQYLWLHPRTFKNSDDFTGIVQIIHMLYSLCYDVVSLHILQTSSSIDIYFKKVVAKIKENLEKNYLPVVLIIDNLITNKD